MCVNGTGMYVTWVPMQLNSLIFFSNIFPVFTFLAGAPAHPKVTLYMGEDKHES